MLLWRLVRAADMSDICSKYRLFCLLATARQLASRVALALFVVNSHNKLDNGD